MAASGVTPVTVVSGPDAGARARVVEALVADRRWAAISIAESGARLFASTGACLCCRVASDLVAKLRELNFARATGALAPFRRVIVEAAGSADPASIVATLAELPLVAARYAPAGIIAAEPIDARLGALADRVVRGDGAPIDAGHLLAIDIYDAAIPPTAPSGESGGIRSFVWRSDNAFPSETFGAALEALVARHGDAILKLQGGVAVADSQRLMGVYGIGHTLFPPAWLERGDRTTRVAFAVRGLEPKAVARILEE